MFVDVNMPVFYPLGELLKQELGEETGENPKAGRGIGHTAAGALA